MKNQNIFEIGKILILFVIFSGFAFSQTQVVIAPTPKPKSKISPKPKPVPKCDDCDKEAPRTPPTNKTRMEPVGEIGPLAPLSEGKRIENEDDIPYEKSIEVEREVAISLDVCEGNVRINGWDRDEVRAFVSGGSKVGFRSSPPKKKNGKTASITVLGYDPKVDKGSNLSNCVYGDEIELDVPIGARISLKGRDAKITVKSIAKITITNNDGDITLSEIEEGITATTYDGNISVENSSGVINLNSADGSIFAYNTEPIEVGDALTAKTTSGAVILQSVNHSVVTARSLSGLVRFQGELQTDGQYGFENTSGQILLEIPEESSCSLEAIAAKNKFSATGFKFVTFNISKIDSTIQKINAVMGDGEATISLQNQSGWVRLIKLN